jgi:CheY-like chemotaxis protein
MSVLNLSFFRKLINKPAIPAGTVNKKSLLLRVLLIERDEHDRKKIGELLHRSFEIIEFDDEFEAVNYVRRNHVDIALINDAVLENINAGRILYLLRENTTTPFRAFALTSHFSELQRAYLKTAGFEHVLAKPMNEISFNDLVYFNKVLH